MFTLTQFPLPVVDNVHQKKNYKKLYKNNLNLQGKLIFDYLTLPIDNFNFLDRF